MESLVRVSSANERAATAALVAEAAVLDLESAENATKLATVQIEIEKLQYNAIAASPRAPEAEAVVVEEQQDDADNHGSRSESEEEKAAQAAEEAKFEQKCRDMFDLVDEDGSGEIDRAELCELCAKLGRDLKPSEFDDAMRDMDADGSGAVDYDEFRPWFKKLLSSDDLDRELHAAASTHDVAKVRELLERGANVNRPQEVNGMPFGRLGQGESPLMAVAAGPHPSSSSLAALLLAHGADVNYADFDGQTALMAAKDVQTIHTLLEAGADPALGRFHDGRIEGGGIGAGQTALHLCAQRGEHDQVAALLLAPNGSNVNETDSHGDTALSCLLAAGARSSSVPWIRVTRTLKTLIEAGAKLCHVNENGETALMKAARSGHLNIVELLIAHGADVNQTTQVRSRWGNLGPPQTALHLAAEGELMYSHVRARLELQPRLEVLATLLNAGGDSTVVKNQLTLLGRAAYDGRDSVLSVLLAHGIDPNRVEAAHVKRPGKTPVYWASKQGHESTVELLLAAGADPDFLSKEYRLSKWWNAK